MNRPSKPFETFCRTLDRIAKAKGVIKKKELLSDFLQDWRMQYGLYFYDPLRLIMPIYCGRKYNLKETTLANVITKALSLSPKSPDTLYLKNYRRPQGNRPSGIFHAAVYDVVARRSLVTRSTQTVHDINELLDSLSSQEDPMDEEYINETTGQKHLKIFKKMIDLYTPHEIQWIIRIILKDLNIHLSEQSVLDVLHPNAKELFETGTSLKDLCRTVADPRGIDSKFNGVKLFSPCMPQLGQKVTSATQESCLDKISKPFYVEQKLDGERFLMHYNPDHNKFMWFTRKKNDNTSRYGSSSLSDTKLSSRIYQGLPRKSVILDGEMVAYDPIFKGFLPFGTLKSTSVNDKGDETTVLNANVDINDPTKPHPCYVVFDILFYDGKSIINSPLEERVKLLNMVVKNQNQHMILMTRQTMSTSDEIKVALDEAVKKQQEGLVIKNPKCKYELNSRNHNWIKFKPDYMDALQENCDVLVVGAKYGSGTYGGVYRQILCAVLDDTDPVPNDPKFVTFAMIHSGLKNVDVSTLNSLAGEGEKFVHGRVPSWLSHPTSSNEKPDKWFYFENALVAEVKGAEVIPSAQFGLAHTLRFPRLVKFRHDKGWKDIMAVSDFKKMQLKGRRGQKHAATEQIENERKSQKRRTYNIVNQGADVSGLKRETALFEGLTFYVMNGNRRYGKNDIEEMIYINGGSFIQTRNADTIVVGSDEAKQSYRLVLFHEKKMHDVRRAQWVLDCIEKQDLIPLEPKYMYVTLDKTRAEFLKRMDEYGDYYTKYANEEQTKELIEAMDVDPSESNEQRRMVCQQVMEECFSDQHMPGFMFLNTVAYFDYDTSMQLDDPPIPKTLQWIEWKERQYQMDNYKDKYEYEMGDVRTSNQDQEVTHVIVNQNDLSRFASLKNNFHRSRLPRFVTLEWIQACIDNRTLVDEVNYQPKVSNQL